MKLVVPFRSHEMVRILVKGCGFGPLNLLLVLVPGIRVMGNLEPDPEVTSEDIPHIVGIPSHIVPIGSDGSVDGTKLRAGDRIILTSNTPSALVWAAACLSVHLEPDSVGIVDGTRMEVMAPIIPAATPIEATEEYDYGGD